MQDNGQRLAIDQAEAFRLIADFTYDWELWLGPAREILYVSPSCERISGYRPESFLADPGLLTAIVHPDDRAAFAHHLEHELHHPEPLSLEFRIVTRTGEERWIHHICQPVHGTDGRWLGRRASNRDVTDRVHAEEAYRNLVLHSRQGLVIFQDGRVVFANETAAAMTGYSLEELVHWRAEEMISRVHAEDRIFRLDPLPGARGRQACSPSLRFPLHAEGCRRAALGDRLLHARLPGQARSSCRPVGCHRAT